MKTVTLAILLLTLTSSRAMERGRDYMREKVCQEFNSIGKDQFRAGAIIASSRKYSNATYEEILNIVNEIVSIAEKCCPEGADPDCYENESLALSARSCRDPSPFPKHPGIVACCAEEGLERKLCQAALKHPPKEFPTYMDPPHIEACKAFTKDPQGFADRYLYDYSSDYSSAPLPVLVASATSYLSMVAKCCAPGRLTPCFVRERVDRKSVAMLTHVSNRACAHYDLLGKERTKTSYTIKFAQKSTNASLEDVQALATDASEVLSRACNSTSADNIQREFMEHATKICSTLSTKDQRFHECCMKADKMEAYFCIYSLPWAKSPHLPDFKKPTDDDLCAENAAEKERYLFEISRRYTYAPEALFAATYVFSQKILAECCSDTNRKACLDVKRPQVRGQLFSLLMKGNELCSEYTHLTFLEFKKKLRETYHTALPAVTEEVLTELVEQRASFASSCCILNAPPIYCGLKAKTGVVETCSHDVCLPR